MKAEPARGQAPPVYKPDAAILRKAEPVGAQGFPVYKPVQAMQRQAVLPNLPASGAATIQRLTSASQASLVEADAHWNTARSIIGTLHDETLPKIVASIEGTPDGAGQESYAKGFSTWLATLKNKITASHAEIQVPSQHVAYGGGRIKLEMGYDTKGHPDSTTYSPSVTMATEAKEVNTAPPSDVDAQIREALVQLKKRRKSPSNVPYTTWIAHIEVRNSDNPYPYTATTFPSTRPTPIELGIVASARNYNGGNKVTRTTTIVVNTPIFGRFQFFAKR
jgi:hypothetical protein